VPPLVRLKSVDKLPPPIQFFLSSLVLMNTRSLVSSSSIT
jgi:hypothetical protein